MKCSAKIAFDLLLAALASVASLASPPANAEAQATVAIPKQGVLENVSQTPLLAKWGPREQLADEGVTLTGHFIAEPGVNDRGYRGSGTTYTQHLDFGANLDLGKLGIADSGTVRILFSDRFGHALQQDRTGAYIQNQAYYGQGQNFRFDELSYERASIDERLSLKAGFYSMGNDFAGLPYTCNFSNNGNCGHPLGLIYGSGWLDSPTGQWGGRLKWSGPVGWYAEAGVYDVRPLRKTRSNGFDLEIDNNTGLIVPLEIGYVRGRTAADYAGTYKLGFYRDSSNSKDIGAPGRIATRRTGGYVQVDQQVWKPRSEVVQGIGVFGVATLADDRTGLFRTSFEAGTSWRGPLANRPDDVLSLGWVKLDINDRLRNLERLEGKATQGSEQLIELNYGVQAKPWLIVRPGLQYVIRPGGYDARPDTTVFVLHVQATL